MLTVDEVDVETNYRALDCYVTYKETIEQSRIKQFLTPQAVFEIDQEAHDPPLESLFDGKITLARQDACRFPTAVVQCGAVASCPITSMPKRSAR